MIWSAGLAVAGVLVACGQASAGVVAGGSWGRVIEVPGLAALNTGKGGGAEVSAVSCGSPGNCAAGGSYWDRRGQQAFVALERDGRWGKATPVPGLAALNVNGNLNGGGWAGVDAVSCAPAGGCAAVGYYAADIHENNGFVVSEKNGVWGKVVTFPTDDFADVDSLSCVSAGNCLAGGTESDFYVDPYQGFVAVERNGRWRRETGLPGLASLNRGGGADVDAAWCAAAGSCVAGGLYSDRNGNSQGFVAVERNGRWGKATPVPGLAVLNRGGDAQLSSLSCTPVGTCVAGGYYAEKGGTDQGFVAVERNGRWAKATAVPGLAALNKGDGPAMVVSVSCAPAGGCAVGGFYTDRSHHGQGFVTREDNGHWGTPIPLPGLAALNKGWSAEVSSLSCPLPSSCTAGGFYTSRSGYQRGYVTQAR